MRSAPIVPTTTCRCEGCGKRCAPGDLWYASAVAQQDVQEGCAFYFSYARGGEIRIDRVLNTVCSQACDAQVSAWKRPAVARHVREVREMGPPPERPVLQARRPARVDQEWTPRDAAAAMGVPLSHLRRWLARDVQGIRAYCVTKEGRRLVVHARRFRIWLAVWRAAQALHHKENPHG